MRKFVLRLVAAVAVVVAASPAAASNVTEFPDNGSEQMGRGGAWVARASDPLATTFNPAGLAGQASRVTLQTNVIIHHTCLTRVKAANDTTQDPLAGAGGIYPRVCNDIAPAINPQIGATWRASDRLGIGVLVMGPSASGTKTFPEFTNDGTGQPQASPNRFLLIKQAGIVLFPTVGVGYEVTDDLRLGASVSWGFAKLSLANATMSLNTDSGTPQSDVRANLQVKDYFIPGFTLGAIWSATPTVDFAGWYKWSDAIRAGGDLGTAANFYSKQNAGGDDRNVRYGDSIYEDCGTGLKTSACGSGENATFKLVIPMEAKLGIRYHKPRVRQLPSGEIAAPPKHVRDPMLTDVFDLEADVTWANNSAADTIQVRFPGDATGKGLLPVSGVQGGEVMPNADQPHGFKDVIGVRVGGDYNVLPDRLALRGGGFFETSAAAPQYQNVDFAAAARFGLALGGTYRVRIGEGERAGAVEIMVGYGHVFVAEQSRTDPTSEGLRGLAGTSCNKSDPSGPMTCADGNPRYRTKWPVNLGTITNAINVLNVGLAYRF